MEVQGRWEGFVVFFSPSSRCSGTDTDLGRAGRYQRYHHKIEHNSTGVFLFCLICLLDLTFPFFSVRGYIILPPIIWPV